MKIKHLLCFIALCLFFTPGKAQQLSVMTLRNGATVYIWEDKSKPDVFGMIAFKVGSVDDPEQYTGLAHYLEHVMFKGTQTIDALDWEKEKPIYEKIIAKYDERAALSDPAAREAIDKEINDLTREAAQYAAGNEFSLLVDHMGGQGLNASTGYDQTEYHNSFPPSQLEKWLEIYSERLAKLAKDWTLPKGDVISALPKFCRTCYRPRIPGLPDRIGSRIRRVQYV